MRIGVVAVIAFLLAVLVQIPAAQSARPPKTAERQGIQIAINRYVRKEVGASGLPVRFTSIRVSTANPIFARAQVSVPGAGVATVALNWVLGWHVYDIGTTAVGCKPPRLIDVPYAAVRRDLKYAPCG